MKAYKLTDQNGQTRNGLQWTEGVEHSATGDSDNLCSDGWIHFYRDPLIAVLMNPIHANFGPARLWECETTGKEIHEALKSGCKTLKTIKELPLPNLSLTTRVAFAILCAKHTCKTASWNTWADGWLSGRDRTADAAYAADDTAYAADDTAYAATHAAHAAVNAAYAASSAAYAAADADAYYLEFVQFANQALLVK